MNMASISDSGGPPFIPDDNTDQGLAGFLERIDARLQVLDTSERAASYDAGLGYDYLRNIRRAVSAGRPPNPTAAAVIALARTLKTSAPFLMGLVDDPSPALLAGGALRLARRGGLAVGIWQEPARMAIDDDASPLSPSPSYAHAAQWAEPVTDEHAEGLSIPEGAEVHCVGADGIGLVLQHGDVVLVARKRPGDAALEERTVRRVVASREGLILSTAPGERGRVESEAAPRGALENDRLRIEALIIAYLAPLNRR